MIKLEGITKSFGSLQVLKGIDLEINKGEIVSIVGPSGDVYKRQHFVVFSRIGIRIIFGIHSSDIACNTDVESQYVAERVAISLSLIHI